MSPRGIQPDHFEEVADYEPSSWPAPPPAPLFVVRTSGDRLGGLGPAQEVSALIDEPLRPLSPRVRPAPGERWVDVGAGYGAFAALACRLGVAAIVPLEPDRELARLALKARFLNDLDAMSEPITDRLTGELVSLLAVGADGLRFGTMPAGTSIGPTVLKVVGNLERREAINLGHVLELEGFRVSSSNIGFTGRARVYAYRVPA